MQPLTFVDITQVHKSTNLTPFSLILSTHPLGPKALSQPSSLPTDSYAKTGPLGLHFNIQWKIATLQGKANTHMRRRGVQYKHHHDRKVHIEPKVATDRWAFIDKPPLAGSRNTSDGIASASYNKLQLRKDGLFRFIKVQSQTVVIYENGVPKTVSIHWITAVFGPESNGHVPETERARQENPLQTVSDEPRPRNERVPEAEPRQGSSLMKFAVEKVVSHKGHGRRRYYIVRCYSFVPENDTLEPARNILKHSTVRYNERKNRQQASA